MEDLTKEHDLTEAAKLTKYSLDIKYLEDDFYRGMRNELTLNKLQQLSILAQKIPEPRFFGTYFNDDHYAITVELMVGSITEARKIGIFLNRLVLPSLEAREKVLDVGPGDGYLIAWIGNKFKQVTAVDINKNFIEQLDVKKRILKRYLELIKIHGSILDVGLTANFYDLALLSHVLYYIDSEKWMSVVGNIYQSLKPNGIAVVVLGGDKFGKANLIKYYQGNPIDIDTLAHQCIAKYGSSNVQVFASKETVITKDIKAMLHIAGLFLHDVQVTATKESLTNYINRHCRIFENHFEMTTQQKFILIRKNS